MRQLPDLEAVLQLLVAEHGKLLAHLDLQQAAMKAFDLKSMDTAAKLQEAARLRIASRTSAEPESRPRAASSWRSPRDSRPSAREAASRASSSSWSMRSSRLGQALGPIVAMASATGRGHTGRPREPRRAAPDARSGAYRRAPPTSK